MLLLVLDERAEEHLRDVRHPHAKTGHAVDHVAGLVPFERVRQDPSGNRQGRRPRAWDRGSSPSRTRIRIKCAEERDAHQVELGRMGLTGKGRSFLLDLAGVEGVVALVTAMTSRRTSGDARRTSLNSY